MASFTHRLRDPSDALHGWFAARLPNTAAVARTANHALRGAPNQRMGQVIALARPREPSLPCRAADHAVAGTALDLLVRATLRPGELKHAVGGRGSGRLAVGPGIPPAIGIELEALARLEALRPSEPNLSDERWRELAELCVLLARFEQAGRSRHAVQFALSRLAGVPATLAGYASALADADVVEDVMIAAPAVAADHADLRAVEPLRFGPTFRLSRALGGADADLIAGDLLLDFKASSSSRVVGRDELWQLAGHARADTDDEFGIRRVGISAFALASPLDGLVRRAAGDAGGPVGPSLLVTARASLPRPPRRRLSELAARLHRPNR